MLFGYTLFHSYNKGVRNKIFEKKVFFIDGVCFCVEVFGWKHAPFRLSSGDFVLHKFSHPSWSLTCTSNTHTHALSLTLTHTRNPLHTQTHTNTHSLSLSSNLINSLVAMHIPIRSLSVYYTNILGEGEFLKRS